MNRDDITAIMTELGCRPTLRCANLLGFRDSHGVFVAVAQEGDLLRIERWSREHETQLTDERDFRKAAEAVLWQ